MSVHFFKCSISNKLKNALVSLMVCGAGAASAGYITADETGMDAVFGQTSFGSSPVDVRFNPFQTWQNSSLLALDDITDMSSYSTGYRSFSSYSSSSLDLFVFFVDTVSYCGGYTAAPGYSFAGCGSMPGNLVVLKSSTAAYSNYTVALMAHEIGHNLNLGHSGVLGAGDNLMNPSLFNATPSYNPLSPSLSLTATQANTVLGNSRVQTDASGNRFISITPIAVVASVPEPETWIMMLSGLLGIGAFVRQRKSKAA
ncbi:PEP-CTERM sorting domain-containing protein [Rhodoferax sp.]|uniref:PEP-CTERM sorting domain-containing protein n=1 Tax=Rhodoferax sp. TaxID=50421 RepID=UPI002614A7FC|nr:PEP-CTERM sorting domain-containing protein [Rhodoferax sp.]MDD5480707.1 zinc-dependent metalloprotease family protein [Rhodoferax sp.]